MEVPRIWRLQKQRYTLTGLVCTNCDKKMFPPRRICPNCKDEVKITSENPTGIIFEKSESSIISSQQS